MPRTSEHSATELGSRKARQRLPLRSSPYYAHIADGLTLGYRRAARGGTWIARRAVQSKLDGGAKGSARYEEKSLGSANDAVESVGLSFQQAQDAALVWFRLAAVEDAGEVITGSYTIKVLMADYLKDRQREKGKSLSDLQSTINARILPTLADVQVGKLTHNRLKAWRDALADGAPMVRVKQGETRETRTVNFDDDEVRRKRKATANRIFSVLRAALNYAYQHNRIASKTAWDRIKPFKQVDAAKVRYLTVAECKRLIDACPADFQRLVRAVLYTGCRYGELTAMKVSAFDAQSRLIHIPKSKSGKKRNIALTDEGVAFFASISGNDTNALMFTHAEGREAGEGWLDSQQRYWMLKVCADAKITPAIGFHILRHTYASQLAMKNTPMPVIASQLGHADTRMTELHYAHLSDSYIADTVRANLPSFGFDIGTQQASHTN